MENQEEARWAAHRQQILGDMENDHLQTGVEYIDGLSLASKKW